jgi:hypothetical protein
METINNADLPAPRRTRDKSEALRHLIETAIRLTARMEDPFAVHLLVDSADKILIDQAKQNGRELRVDLECFSLNFHNLGSVADQVGRTLLAKVL